MKSLLFSLVLVSVLALAPAALGQDKPSPGVSGRAQDAKDKSAPDPYPLTTCPISGGKLGSMGEPVTKVYDGREVRFCCDGCPPKFEKDLAKNMAKLDEAIIKDQQPVYPLDTSVVSGKELNAAGKPYDFVYQSRLVRLAAESEKADFLKDSAKHLATLDKAAIEKQSKEYPLKKCPISGEELGKMGEPKDIVVAGRLVRLCCPACEKDVRKDPAKTIAMIDDARKPKKEVDKKP